MTAAIMQSLCWLGVHHLSGKLTLVAAAVAALMVLLSGAKQRFSTEGCRPDCRMRLWCSFQYLIISRSAALVVSRKMVLLQSTRSWLYGSMYHPAG